MEGIILTPAPVERSKQSEAIKTMQKQAIKSPQPPDPPRNHSQPTSKNPKPPEKKQKSPENTFYSMPEVSKHNTVRDAWTVIRGQVYDITNFFSAHPGGQAAIMKIMGKDGTRLFGRRK